jgi:glycosyltransferase involved in cell wall biosynthesis
MKSNYKILLITDNHNPAGGGAEKYFFILKHALQQRAGLMVHSLGFASEEIIDKDTTLLRETPSKLLRYWWRLVFNPVKYFQIKRAIKNFDPDVIHLHNVKKYTISLLKAVRGYKVIQTVHDFTPICPTGWNLHRDLQPCSTGLTAKCFWQHKRNGNPLIYLGQLYAYLRTRALLKQTVTKFIAPSPILAEYLNKNHFHQTVYLPPFRKASRAIDYENQQPQHFLYVGQLGKHKGVDEMIDEFALACARQPNLVLSVAGAGERETELKHKVKKISMEKNINFLGWENPEKLYDTAVAVIFSSIGMESFGLVLTEAMQHGRAILGTNRGPTAWLVEHEETGLLYDPLKKGDLAAAILQIANDMQLANEMGRKGFAKVNRMLTNEEIMKEMEFIYRTI